MRGLVILLLVPDLSGAFSLHEMARRHPDDALWATLAAQATHVPWIGMALWDLVMPAFVLLAGVAMALSVDRRRAAGAGQAELTVHAVLRGSALILLGLLLQMTRDSVWLELLPYAVLAAALPWGRWTSRTSNGDGAQRQRVIELVLLGSTVTAVALWLASHTERLGPYDFNQILTQLGLAYVPAFVLMGRDVRTPLLAALAIVAAYGMAFILYAPPPALPVHGEAMAGLFSHWNNGTNVAAAVDRWLFELLPRSEPYRDNAHGYHTIEFIPLIADMLIGAAAGRLIARGGQRAALRVAALGAAAAIGGGLLALTIFPLIKSLWTPSWALASAGLCLLGLCVFMIALDAPGRALLAYPLVVLGANALLLYVMSGVHRWRIVMYAERLAGPLLTQSPWRPLLQSFCVLAALWLLAAVLNRFRVHVRL